MANKQDAKTKDKLQPATTAMYSCSEILGAAASFEVVPELLAGALALSEEATLTRAEVVTLIKRFKERKVL